MVHASTLGEDRVRVTGVFASNELEAAYRLRHAPQDRFFGRVIVASAAITTIVLGAVDYQIFPGGPKLTALWAVRVAFFILSMVALYFLRGEPRPAALERLLGAWYCLSVGLHVYIGCVWPAGHIEFRMTAALAVIMSYCIFPLSLRLQTFGAGLYTVSSLFVAWVNPPNDFSSTLSDLSWLALLNILGGFLSYRLHARQRMLFAALQRQSEMSASLAQALAEVRTLRGMIRVCAWCHKVDVGGDWQQLERYVRDHSHAEFTHGICPICMAAATDEAK